MRRTLVAFLPLLLWAAAVLVVGGLEMEIDASLPSISDKAAPFAMYGVGGVLAAWAARYRGPVAGLLALVFVLLTGGVDELRQGTLAARDADIWDWVADAAGATLAFLATRVVLGRKRSG